MVGIDSHGLTCHRAYRSTERTDWSFYQKDIKSDAISTLIG